MFAPGAHVRVKDDWPETRGPVHIRTPHYLRGMQGTVVRTFGAYPNPEDLAFARPAARRMLYHVAFDQPAVWQEGRAGDELLVETLRTLAGAGMMAGSSCPAKAGSGRDAGGSGVRPRATMNILETDGEKLLAAVRDLLAAKGLVSNAEISERIAITDAANPGQGARMVAKAWTDPAYRALMLEDGTKAAEDLGIPMRGAPPLGVLENTAEVHNLVVCTLCSCYPRAVLGYPPFWFKSAAYRARGVRDPRGLIAEWGTVLPEGVKIRVVDSTADYRWMVLPRRPAGTEGWSEERLAAIVREGDMIGVTVPALPAQ